METDLYLDNDGYPTDLALTLIEEANPLKQNPHDLMAFIKSLWQYVDWGWSEKKKRDYANKKTILYSISTGGWSGNESIVYALKNNKNFFWTLYWRESKVGGHYKFLIPKKVITKSINPTQPHPHPTCGNCGNEMGHNVPRLGDSGGFVHKETGMFECFPKNPINPITPINPINPISPKATANSREFKFRVWDHLTNTWNYFDIRSTLGHIPTNVPNSQIQQFTGFVDKNGKEVYEGDILEFYGLKGCVTFLTDSGGCYFGFQALEDKNSIYPLYNSQKYGIIGGTFNNK